VLPRWQKQCDEEATEVIDAGGLYVLGTERHDSRRIDNQLRGRSGRQGDPGESRFYLSLQDELMKRFRAGAVEVVMDRLNIPEDVPIESKMVSRQIKSAQTQIEAQNAEIRKDVLKYDEVLNQQRQVIYGERRRVLAGEDLHDQVRHMIDDVVRAYVAGATAEGYAEDWDLEQLWQRLKMLYPVGVTIEELEDEAGSKAGMDPEFLAGQLVEDANAAYDRREEELGTEPLRDLERQVLLAVIDRKWREHLYEMDYLRDGVSLRAYAQRDPLVEYQREGFDMFAQMLDGVKEQAVEMLFNIEVQFQEPAPAPEVEVTGVGAAPKAISAKGLSLGARRPQALQYSAPEIDGAAGSGGMAVVQETAPALGIGGAPGGSSPGAQAANRRPAPGQAVGTGPSRNAPCPCGSGKKYKRCHGAPTAA
jgi:preprotein translocase subunit SecA